MRIYSKKAFALGEGANRYDDKVNSVITCLLYTSPSPRDRG